MPRAKGGFKTRRRRKKVLERASGFFGGRSRLYRVAAEAVDHALRHEYAHRKQKKGDFRSLWIIRINAAVRASGLTYSQFMNALKKSDVALNRKVLADMAANDPDGFTKLIESVKQNVSAPRVAQA
jgi:large subunit ribosomal protein L20